MRFQRFIQTFAAAIMLIGAAVSPSASAFAADGAISSEQRLSDGVLLYLSIPDVKAAHASFQKTGMSQLIHDPELEKFRAHLVKKFNEAAKKAEDELGLSTSDLLSLFSGELSVAVVRPVGQPLGSVFFMDIGNHQATLDKIIAKIEEAVSKEDKVEKGTETIDGVTVKTYSITVSNNPDADRLNIAYLVKDQKLVVATGVSILESVLELWDGKGDDTFASNEVYKEIISKTSGKNGATPAFKYFMDPVGLLATGLGMQQETQLFASMVYAPAFGLVNFKGVGGTIELATDEYDSISRSMLYVDGPASGILKIFELRPTISAPPAWVPENAGQFVAFDWNIQGAYEAIESIYDSFTGPGKFAEQITNLSRQSGTDLHIKKDVIDVLSGQIQWYMIPSDSPSDLQGTLAIGVKDAAKGQKLVDTVFNLAGGADTSDFQGIKLTSSASGDENGAAAVKDNMILIAKSPEQLKLTLSGPAKAPLTSSSDYQALGKLIPQKVSLLAFQDPADQLEAAYEKARSGELDSLTEGELDLTLLPPFDVLRKYLSPSASYYVPDEHGSIGVQFSLKRE